MSRERDDMLAYQLHCFAFWSLDINIYRCIGRRSEGLILREGIRWWGSTYSGALFHGHKMAWNSTYENSNKYDMHKEGGYDAHETHIRERRTSTNSRLFIVKHLVFLCLPRFGGEQTRTISDKPIRSLLISAQPLHPT
jgi:hypothetical protein